MVTLRRVARGSGVVKLFQKRDKECNKNGSREVGLGSAAKFILRLEEFGMRAV